MICECVFLFDNLCSQFLLCVAGDADQMMLGPRFKKDGSWRPWRTNYKLFSWRQCSVNATWGWTAACWILHIQQHIVMKASTQPQPEEKQSPKVAKGRHHLKLLASYCDLWYWPDVYWSGHSITSFSSRCEVWQQNASTEFVPTHSRHTTEESLSEFWSILNPGPGDRTFV